MADIVERLRHGWPEGEILSKDMPRVRADAVEAADTITQLRAEVAERENTNRKLNREKQQLESDMARERHLVLEVAGVSPDAKGVQAIWEAGRRLGGAMLSFRDRALAAESQAAEARNKALEEAATVATNTKTFDWSGGDEWAAGYVAGKDAAAAAIRSLKDSARPKPKGGTK